MIRENKAEKKKIGSAILDRMAGECPAEQMILEERLKQMREGASSAGWGVGSATTANRKGCRQELGRSVAEQSEAEKACRREGPRVRISGDIRFLPQMSRELLEDFQKKSSAI